MDREDQVDRQIKEQQTGSSKGTYASLSESEIRKTELRISNAWLAVTALLFIAVGRFFP